MSERYNRKKFQDISFIEYQEWYFSRILCKMKKKERKREKNQNQKVLLSKIKKNCKKEGETEVASQ